MHKQSLHNDTILRKFVESYSSSKGTNHNATRRRDFRTLPGVPRKNGRVRCKHLKCGRAPKKPTYPQILHLSTPIDENLLDGCLNDLTKVNRNRTNRGEREGGNTHGFLHKCQPPACSRSPGGNYRQEREDAVSGREDGNRGAGNTMARQQNRKEKGSSVFRKTTVRR